MRTETPCNVFGSAFPATFEFEMLSEDHHIKRVPMQIKHYPDLFMIRTIYVC